MQDPQHPFYGYIAAYLQLQQDCLRLIPIDAVFAAVTAIQAAHGRGSTVYLCGNGGSASMASHFAADLNKSTMMPHLFDHARRFRAIALTDNVALMTAWANDVAYERVFAEPVRSLGQNGDILFIISGSGNSPNVLAALDEAHARGMITIGLTGKNGGHLRERSDICISVATDAYEHNEPLHSVVFHIITFYLKQVLQQQTLPDSVAEPSQRPA